MGKAAEVRIQEIEALRKSLKGIVDDISIKQLVKGSRYTIPQGPFKGQEGSVVKHFKNKLKLELTSLGLIVTLTTA